jgi:hypothetical protein
MKLISRIARWPRDLRRQCRQVVGFFRDVSWKESPLLVILQVLFTAGPVTYIALNAGYRIGYGTTPPHGLFVHIAVFTTIGGLFAYLFSVLQRANHEPRAARIEMDIIQAVNLLAELVFDLRNHLLKSLPQTERERASALHILRNPFLNEPAVEIAVQTLTGNAELARAARRIEVFRRNGLYAAIDDARATVQNDLDQALAELEASAPDAVPLLRSRFYDRKLVGQQEVERPEGFLERALLAAESSDPQILSHQDAIHVYALLLELLSGRVISYLQPQLVGNSELAQAQNDLVKARARYRIARMQRNGTLRALAEFLSEDSDADRIAATAIETLAPFTSARLTNLIADTEALLGSRTRDAARLRALAHELERAARLSRRLWQRHQLTVKTALQLQRQERRFAAAYERSGRGFSWTIVDRPALATGIYIDPTEISLGERERAQLAVQVAEAIRHEEHRVAEAGDDLLPPLHHKHLAMHLTVLLNTYLPLSEPDIQQAVEATTAPRVTSLDSHLGGRLRATWAMSMVGELQQDQRRAVHRMARSLVEAYGAPLSDTVIETLVRRFGADLQYLLSLRKAQPDPTPAGLTTMLSAPIMLEPHYKTLQGLAERTARRLRRLERLNAPNATPSQRSLQSAD